MAHKQIGRDIDPYLTTTEYLDANHPLVRSTADTLTRGTTGDVERVGRIYHYVRDLPYDILASFGYLAEVKRSASDVIEHGVAFCMGKASSFVALSRAAGVPARGAFQTLASPTRNSSHRRCAVYGEARRGGRCPGTRLARPT